MEDKGSSDRHNERPIWIVGRSSCIEGF